MMNDAVRDDLIACW